MVPKEAWKPWNSHENPASLYNVWDCSHHGEPGRSRELPIKNFWESLLKGLLSIHLLVSGEGGATPVTHPCSMGGAFHATPSNSFPPSTISPMSWFLKSQKLAAVETCITILDFFLNIQLSFHSAVIKKIYIGKKVSFKKKEKYRQLKFSRYTVFLCDL